MRDHIFRSLDDGCNSHHVIAGKHNDFTFELHRGKDQRLHICKEDRKPIVTFLRSDIDHLVRGLIENSAKNIGRVTSKQMIDIVDYWAQKS